jgi:predicted nucleic acid-binding protein
MDEVFVDTAAWIALLDEADSLHRKATEVLERLSANKSRLVTTEFVLLESRF